MKKHIVKKKINFSKMHGLGNDFVVINKMNQNCIITSKIIRKLSNRHTGIGFDQLLLIENALVKNVDFHYRIFNADGIEVNQCGNGARCLALFVLLKKIVDKTKIYVSTNNRILVLDILKNKEIRVDMGVPLFLPKFIPYLGPYTNKLYTIKIFDKKLNYSVVSIGNPHCIVYVDEIKDYPVKKIGYILSSHKLFPQGVNVSFVKIMSKNHITIRVYERGVGETLACGSAACAAVASGISQKFLSNKVIVNLLGGNLDIQWTGNHQDKLYMTGPAKHVYDGCIYI